MKQLKESAGNKPMMRLLLMSAVAAGLLAASGCAHRNGVYGSVYEGLQTRERLVNPSPEQSPHEIPRPVPYDQYAAERKKLLDGAAPP
jgi:hypothetical protein